MRLAGPGGWRPALGGAGFFRAPDGLALPVRTGPVAAAFGRAIRFAGCLVVAAFLDASLVTRVDLRAAAGLVDVAATVVRVAFTGFAGFARAVTLADRAIFPCLAVFAAPVSFAGFRARGGLAGATALVRRVAGATSFARLPATGALATGALATGFLAVPVRSALPASGRARGGVTLATAVGSFAWRVEVRRRPVTPRPRSATSDAPLECQVR